MIIKIVGLLLTSIIKFIIVPYIMVEMGYGFITIVIIHSSGAALGVFVFYNFGDLIFRMWNSWLRRKQKSIKRRRWIIKIKNKYELRGLLFISALISVPITSLLAARYFKTPTTLAKLIMAFFFWSLALTSISFIIFNLIH